MMLQAQLPILILPCLASVCKRPFLPEEVIMSAHFSQRKAGLVRIEVMRNDGTFFFCHPQMLDALLEKNHVTKFKRKSGWVIVGVDPVRTKPLPKASQLFDGHERRASY
jgi:hypothetical protein